MSPVTGDAPDTPPGLVLILEITPYLVLTAEILKPDWDHDVLADAIIGAGQAGWTPGRLMREFAILVTSEDTSPWDLKRAAAAPTAPREQTGTRAMKVPEYAAFRAQLAAIPPLPEHRTGSSG